MENMTNVIVENEKDLENVVELVEEVLTDNSIEVVKGSKGTKVALAIAGIGFAAAIGYKVYNHFKKKNTVDVEANETNDDLDDSDEFIDDEINEEPAE